MERTLWLDGLRGLASACVAICHAVMFDSPRIFGFAYRSYWAEPPEENRRLIQLPPFRIIFAGSSMVSLFMVISGFAISIPLLKARDQDPTTNAGFFHRLSSTATRRIFRLYLPAFLSAVLAHFLFFCDLYKLSSWTVPWDGLPKPLTSPWSHLKYLLWSMAQFLDISNRQQMNLRHGRLDPNPITVNLWTMPVEFRGSLTVYLMMLTLAFWRPQPRRLVLAAVAMYWFYMGQWDLFSFIAGFFIAEGYVGDDIEADGELELPCQSPTTKKSRNARAWRKLTKSNILCCFRTTIIFILAILLLCMCEDESMPPEYEFLRAIQSSQWDQDEIARRSWSSVGAVFLIYAVQGSPLLQVPLNSRLVQYLGRISFPLYLLHNTVYFVFKERIRNLIWLLLMRTTYPGSDEASKDALPFSVAYGGAFLACGVILICVSDLWERTIDKRCLYIARRFEKRVAQ